MFSKTLFVILFAGCASQASIAPLCETVFLPAPGRKIFIVTSEAPTVRTGPVPDFTRVAKQVDQLGITLSDEIRRESTMPIVTKMQIVEPIPRDTEELQALGYDLMKSLLRAADVDLRTSALVTVYADKQLPWDHLINSVHYEMGLLKRNPTIESDVADLAATIGDYNDLTIIRSSYRDQKTGNRSGWSVRSILIINRYSGVMAQMTFFSRDI